MMALSYSSTDLLLFVLYACRCLFATLHLTFQHRFLLNMHNGFHHFVSHFILTHTKFLFLNQHPCFCKAQNQLRRNQTVGWRHLSPLEVQIFIAKNNACIRLKINSGFSLPGILLVFASSLPTLPFFISTNNLCSVTLHTLDSFDLSYISKVALHGLNLASFWYMHHPI